MSQQAFLIAEDALLRLSLTRAAFSCKEETSLITRINSHTTIFLAYNLYSLTEDNNVICTENVMFDARWRSIRGSHLASSAIIAPRVDLHRGP